MNNGMPFRLEIISLAVSMNHRLNNIAVNQLLEAEKNNKLVLPDDIDEKIAAWQKLIDDTLKAADDIDEEIANFKDKYVEFENDRKLILKELGRLRNSECRYQIGNVSSEKDAERHLMFQKKKQEAVELFDKAIEALREMKASWGKKDKIRVGKDSARHAVKQKYTTALNRLQKCKKVIGGGGQNMQFIRFFTASG